MNDVPAIQPGEVRASVPGASSKQIVAALACLSVLAVAAFHAVLGNRYTYDAIHTIRDNPHVERGAPLGEIFRVPYWDPKEYPGRGLYRPLAVASFWVTRAFFHQPLRVDHALDVGLQVACGLLVMLVLMELGADFRSRASWGVAICSPPSSHCWPCTAPSEGRESRSRSTGSPFSSHWPRCRFWPRSPRF
jgi:hypothetical protein